MLNGLKIVRLIIVVFLSKYAETAQEGRFGAYLGNVSGCQRIRDNTVIVSQVLPAIPR
jgi:hypothetical protein